MHYYASTTPPILIHIIPIITQVLQHISPITEQLYPRPFECTTVIDTVRYDDGELRCAGCQLHFPCFVVYLMDNFITLIIFPSPVASLMTSSHQEGHGTFLNGRKYFSHTWNVELLIGFPYNLGIIQRFQESMPAI